MHHEERHLVSNVVGTDDMRIELGPPLKLARYDTVLLASDGLLDNLYTDEIVELIRKGLSVSRSASSSRLLRNEWPIPSRAFRANRTT